MNLIYFWSWIKTILKHNLIHSIYIIFIISNSISIFSQEIILEINSKIDIENKVLNTIDFVKTHKDSTSVKLEIQKISSYLKNIGYFTNTIDSIIKRQKKIITFFSLNKKVEKVILLVKKNDRFYFRDFKVEKNSVRIPIEYLQSTLNKISRKLDSEGKSFSKVKLKNISIKNNVLFAELQINQSNKRVFNKITIKGYEKFPRSFLKNYFRIHQQTVFNQKKIKETSLRSKNLKFAKEIKTPEVLFKKDSTILFLYLKKQQNNSFDGIINFASKENGGVLFNGNLDLRLNNVLDTGEEFNLFWNSIGEEKQEFSVSAKIPFILNSKFSPEISFLIYKQDSTFLNTKLNSKLFYSLNHKTKLALTYTSEISENLEKNITSNINSFNNYFLGFQFELTIPENDFFFNNKFHFEINPTYGKRKTDQGSLNQFKIESTLSYIWDLSFRSSIYLRNKTGYLDSNSFLENELFRIGGANSLRGFNEQSIFTNSYSFFNIEYRYLTSNKSFLYTISDFGSVKINNKNETLYGIGVGYAFFIQKSKINVGGVLGGNSLGNLNVNNFKLILSWKSFF